MKVHVITQGDYSDYHIVAVVSTEELRDEAIKQFTSSYDDADSEEWEVDDIAGLVVGHYNFNVLMDRNGNATTQREGISENKLEDYPDISWGSNGKMFHTGSYRFKVLATDEVHAVKIANERRIQLIADNKWPEAGTKYERKNVQS